jgi:hypothetical protein
MRRLSLSGGWQAGLAAMGALEPRGVLVLACDAPGGGEQAWVTR